jgi:pimeloyl-ACP methyl ester carboxylesterase
MKKVVLLLFVFLFIVRANAQAEPVNYASAMAKFRQLYNNNHADSIFNMFSADMKKSLPLETFKSTTAQLRMQYGDLLKVEFVKYRDKLAAYKATFKGGTFLLNLAVDNNNQLNGLFLSPYQANAAGNRDSVVVKEDNAVPKQNDAVAIRAVAAPKPANATANVAVDPDVTESPVTVKTLSGVVSGTLTMPAKATEKVPLVIIVADAGPTDRDGNNEKTGVKGNTYKLLAEGLAKNGIASIRYDKRMVGQSQSNEKESELRMDDYSDDAVSIILAYDEDPRFSKLILFGHGEGALVSMVASLGEPVKGYISAEGTSEQADKIINDEMKKKPQYQADEVKAILDSLRKGKLTTIVDPTIYYIARPSIQNFLMSWCRLVPLRGIKAIKVPVLLIQGTTDLTVPVIEAEKLKKARSDANLVIIKGMNHILKDAPADEDQNMATYDKPDLPLDATLVPAIVDFVKNKTKD